MHAAVEMQQRINSLPPVSGVTLAIRIGFHYGMSRGGQRRLRRHRQRRRSRRRWSPSRARCLPPPRPSRMLPPELRELVKEIEVLRQACKDEASQFFEVTLEPRRRGSDQARLAAMRCPRRLLQGHRRCGCSLRHGDQKIILGPDRPNATLGRDRQGRHRQSGMRAHRAIMAASSADVDKFVLIDQSTNGTYVTIRGRGRVPAPAGGDHAARPRPHLLWPFRR